MNRREFTLANLGLLGSAAGPLLTGKAWALTAPAGEGELTAQIDEAARDYLSTRKEATMMIGVTVRGKRTMKSFGSPGAAKVSLPDERTIYEVGSISKVFSATVLSVMLGNGELALSDTVAQFLPVDLPPEIGSITLLQLATHTSGLPRVLPIFYKMVMEDVHTCYERYKKEDLYKDLQGAKLEREKETEAVYSIIGMGLLGHIIELKAGKPYRTVMQEIVCRPLKLEDTDTTLSAAQTRRLVHGYDSEGKLVPNWEHDVLKSQGAVRSTAHDMMLFAEANLRGDNSSLSQAMIRAQTLYFDGPGGPWGLGWYKLGRAFGVKPIPGYDVWAHDGATAAYRSHISVCRKAQVGVFALTSDGNSLYANSADLPRVSRNILNTAVGVASTA